MDFIDDNSANLGTKIRRPASNDFNPPRFRDVLGRTKVAMHQNIYEADFEYGAQPLRWESFTAGAASIAHLPGEGGVRMRLTTAAGDVTIRQSRPYHRYQPGKTMFMATAVNFGTTQANQVQRVGFFDDANGAFFEQAPATVGNPFGMGVVIRSDTGNSTPVDQRFDLVSWNGDENLRSGIDWTRIQMLFIEYAWYGAGLVRFGVFINGEPYVLHSVGFGNRYGQAKSWSRTGNLPVRYEQRNTGATATSNDMIHYGVSVCVEGRVDDQRGFTYSYGMAPTTPRRAVAAATTRFPLITIRGRVMGTQEFTQASSAVTAGTTTSLTLTGTPLTVDQFKGRCLNYYVSGVSYMARITTNTTSTLTLVDNVLGGPLAVAPVAGQNFTIGQVNRGQLLPRTLLISSDAICVVEIIESTPQSPIVLTGAALAPLATLGSSNSFAERDVSATAMTGGEVVMAFTAPAGGSGLQTIDLSNLFALHNVIRGNVPDFLSIAITTSAVGANVGAHIICQEAMS